jgi:Replication-relaxation
MLMSPPLPQRTAAKDPSFALTAADTAILRALLRYRSLVNTQITQLVYDSRSDSLVRERLKRLTDRHYCLASPWPQKRQRRGGSNRLVYHLGPKGLQFLRAAGETVPHRLRLSDQQHGDLFYSHTIAANAVLIGAELLARRTPAVTIADLRSEWQLKATPARVRLPDGTTRTYIPDGWLDIRTANANSTTGWFRDCLVLELDQGTARQDDWRAKVAAAVVYSTTAYQERFGTDTITIAVVATPGSARRDTLLAWTEAALVAHGAQAQADLFRFTATAPDAEPAEFFLGAHWYTPFDAEPASLLSLEGHA